MAKGSSQRTSARDVEATLCFGEPTTARPPIQSLPRRHSLPERSQQSFLCALGGYCLCLSQIFLRSCSVRSRVRFLTLPPDPSETPANYLSSTFVLNLNGPSGLSTSPLPAGILSRVRGSPKCLECLHLHHPNAHERPAPPPAAPPFLPQKFDYKSFTAITLMPCINASFLTSASRGSIDSRIGAV